MNDVEAITNLRETRQMDLKPDFPSSFLRVMPVGAMNRAATGVMDM
jgi:hypothetical protein